MAIVLERLTTDNISPQVRRYFSKKIDGILESHNLDADQRATVIGTFVLLDRLIDDNAFGSSSQRAIRLVNDIFDMFDQTKSSRQLMLQIDTIFDAFERLLRQDVHRLDALIVAARIAAPISSIKRDDSLDQLDALLLYSAPLTELEARIRGLKLLEMPISSLVRDSVLASSAKDRVVLTREILRRATTDVTRENTLGVLEQLVSTQRHSAASLLAHGILREAIALNAQSIGKHTVELQKGTAPASEWLTLITIDLLGAVNDRKGPTTDEIFGKILKQYNTVERRKMFRTSISKALNKLVEDGYVVADPPRAKGVISNYALTPEGLDYVAGVRAFEDIHKILLELKRHLTKRIGEELDWSDILPKRD